MANAYEEAGAEQPRKRTAFWNDAFQEIKASAIRLSTLYVGTGQLCKLETQEARSGFKWTGYRTYPVSAFNQA